jgi:two-component system CheB/CheR fusion protein
MNPNKAVTDEKEIPKVNPPRPYLVGIGSSAGGLEALSALIAALPSNLGISYVIIQHLSPTHKSMLVQLLGRETPMAVVEIQDNTAPEPDVIYVAPASRNTIFQDGCFKLLETRRETLPKPSVNVFLTSLAAEKSEDAIGVVLSGTGSDGTVGLREVKLNGGFTFAQEPSSAKYTGMPQSAIDSGCVDWVLPPEKIAVEITSIVRNRPAFPGHLETVQPQSLATQLKKLLINVKHKTRIDFGGYKEGTLWRRIERRMAANHLNEFEDYLQFTDDNPDELDRLSKDILISVTAFFRDKESFEKLKKVLELIVSTKQPGDEIRIWVPACATGEEAYSIAILLAETIGSTLSQFKVQIFATDIDQDAMAIARKGVYLEGSLAEQEPEMLNRFFINLHGQYEINRTIRDMVVFARQDLILDPPFLRLDLVSCRNVLIYFHTDIQAKILATFHYGLADGGYLFLGKSESVYQQDSLFDDVDKTHRIYRRRAKDSLIPLAVYQLPHLNTEVAKYPAKKNNAEQKLMETAVRVYVPPTILVNHSLDIQHIFGDVSNFLSISAGKPSMNLMHLIKRELRPDLQLLQHQVEQQLDSVIGRTRNLRLGGALSNIRLAIHPTEKNVAGAFFLVSFETLPENTLQLNQSREYLSELDADTKLNFRELEDELIMTRERLQTVIEELETSNEELQALNEEVQSANEELQSSNEELEATNEELQSTNEELTTVNEELQIRTNELAEALNELESIQNSVGYPILAVNEQLKILRFNAPAATLFLLNQSSLGQHFANLRLPVGMKSFTRHIEDAMRNDVVIEDAIPSVERHYLLHVSPYKATQGSSRGAIVTLVDDTERRASEEAVKSNREKLLAIMNNSTAIITLKDIAGRYEFVNRQFEKIFAIKAEDILGKTDSQFLPEAIADDFRTKELEVIRKLQTIESEDHLKHRDFDLHMLSIRFPLIGSDNLPYGVCTQSSDITARVQAESQLRLAARVFDRSSEGIVVTDPKKEILTVNEAFSNITGYSAEEVIGKLPTFYPQAYKIMLSTM